MKDAKLHSLKKENLRRQTEQLLLALPKREELTLRLRFGFGGRASHTYREIAQVLGYSVSSVRRFERKALKRLQHLTVSEMPANHIVTPLIQDVQFVIEKVEMLTPELIQHLKNNQHDLARIKWEVFQHLVGEFLKSQGFDDVRNVGRNPATSADLYAAKTLSPDGLLIRVFVEVKRTSGQVGIEVINEVAGAMLTERPTIGWHAAMIVSRTGFRDFRKFNPYELSLLGIELKNKDDLLKWLDDYEPNERGRWLPKPNTKLPKDWNDS